MHTDHRFTDQQVPGIGMYVEVHWQGRALGNRCSRVPGPTDWQYQGLVRLTAPDAAALAKSRAWQPSGAPVAWPALAVLIPAGAAWTAPATSTVNISFEPNRALVFFTLTDS